MKEIDITKIEFNPVNLIARDWMLVSAGSEKSFNTMTASWGHIGSLWGHMGGSPTVVIYIRPTRYTKEFVDREEIFTLTFFKEEFKKDLAYLGSHSGRNEDKLTHTGLTPIFIDGTIGFKEAELTLVCKKLYVDEIKEEGFIDKSLIDDMYPKRDYHTVYIAQIIKAYSK